METGKGKGMMNAAGSGYLRVTKNPKSKQAQAQKSHITMLPVAGGGANAGLMSTVTLSQTQGIELVNPN